MTLNEIEFYFKQLSKDKYLVILDDNDELVGSFIYDFITNSIQMYFNIFKIDNLNSFSVKRFVEKHLNDNFNYAIVDKSTWILYNKRKIKKVVDNYLKSDDDNNAKSIYSKVIRDGGKFVNDGLSSGILIGAVSSDEDYYYLLLKNDKQIVFCSCVGGYNIIEEIPNDYSAILWLVEHDKESLIKIVNDRLSDVVDVLFTPIVLTPQKTGA